MKTDIKPGADETLDSIKDIKLFQARNGYRFSVDALLLEDFISAKRLGKGMDLGAGSGIVSILLAKRRKDTEIISVEIQESLAERAKRNVSLNRLDDRIEILSKDIKELKKLFSTNTFDFVFSNPPFRKPKTGRLSIYEERAVARHELEITLPDLISTALYLLKHTGKFYLIYHPFRLAELISLLRKAGLEPKRIRFVHSRTGEEARMVLIEAVKGSGIWLKIAPPLYIYEKGNEYTPEMKRILKK
ncbi:MAG TPA: tRNA1(Val) (adenine(37)-N6)-methyltransferase [Nitrospirae bacterium]|nr:tRNA1(Val) (adenine(37)-N6)-methyltransferase [Nitrospirota bacterium]HDL20957.1 tRNA1(Val) (adenine(37)-N6)-methyltransferase [Nitrospirota bacterium]HDZ01556.1 tRNA1(Val) (adenine(37)-N6)-methyltransferase [Nitrospirota bacterium]